MELRKVRVFPSEEFDYLDTGKELLEKFCTLIRENRSLPAGTKKRAHEPGLYRCHDEEDSETSQGTRAQVVQEDDQTDNQLDRSCPAGVKKSASGVDTGNVGRDVIDQFAIGVDMPSTSGECKCLVVNRGD